ncbi:MAG TPA: hypothetical protein VKE51_36615 [Vicinamibacterales bacterium]|nr:hypothetical protein [Vicinamibacterales bacterium]
MTDHPEDGAESRRRVEESYALVAEDFMWAMTSFILTSGGATVCVSISGSSNRPW